MRVSKFVFRRRLGNACANSMSFWLWVYLLVCSLKFILYIMIAQTIFLTYCQGPTMVHFTLRKAGFQVMNQSLQILFSNTGIPANICWSWRRLQHVFILTNYVFQDVLKMSWRQLARRLGRRKIVTLKTSWRHALKMSWIISLFILLWNSSSISILRIKISDDWFGFVKSAEFNFEITEKMRQ